MNSGREAYMDEASAVSTLLHAWGLQRERPDCTLQPTALVAGRSRATP
jgi:hypothetical protein